MLCEITLRVLCKCSTSRFCFKGTRATSASHRQRKVTTSDACMHEDRRSACFMATCLRREGTCAFASNNASSINEIGQIERKYSIAARARDFRVPQYQG